ncbi:IS110 family transposase [Labrys okinawensis]|uniref:IS110 family transposase n=1 Tax=Labrys okinawensis TaxID=346911 RepID=UPI0039BD5F8B
MTSSLAHNVGTDIGKDHLDVAVHPAGLIKRFANTQAGHRALLAWLSSWTVERVVFEATGAYHRAFERALNQAGLPAVKLNPRQARRFAEGIGRLAKTDRIDAMTLARYGQAVQPEPTLIVSPALEEMKQLAAARDALMKIKVATQTRQQTAELPLIKRQLAKTLALTQAQINAIDEEIARRADKDPAFKRRAEILDSIPAVAPITAHAMLIHMPELGTLSPPQAASLAGLAPVPRDSGSKNGKRFIRGGRALLRRALYMPMVAAIRWNPDLAAKYQAMVAAGKPKKIAIVAIMRKLIILANALLRDNRIWTPKAA